MAYEVFRKNKERRERLDKERPLMVAMDKQGRLMINRSFFKTIETNSFKKTEILIDYDSQKIGLRMLSDEGESGSAIKKITIQPHKTRSAFISFVTVKKALKLVFPFVRHATWDQKNSILEFSWNEEKNA